MQLKVDNLLLDQLLQQLVAELVEDMV